VTTVDSNLMFCMQKYYRKKYYKHSKFSSTLINIPERHVSNYLSEVDTFNKL